MAEHPTPAPPPPGGRCPTTAWAVTTGGDHDGYEVAAVFADSPDARQYAAWWNDEEIRRYGHLTTHAVTEEIDFYPAGTWRPPTHLHLAETDAAPNDTGFPTPREPAVDDPPCANGSTGRGATLGQGPSATGMA